jgi:hypothetical protein
MVSEPDPNSGIVSFKPGKGLDIKSNDGNFSVNVRLKTQLMNEVHKLKSADKASEDFFVRRLRLAFQGNVFSKDIKYKIELTAAAAEMGRTDPRTAERLVAGSDPMMMTQATLDRDEVSQTPLLDAYFDFTQLRDLSIRVGQSKIPYGRERMWSDNEMIVVDRSLEDTEFNFDRDMGIDIRSSDFLGIDMLHYYLGMYVAEDRNSALTTLGRGDLGFIYNGRIEFLPLGNFEEVATDFDRNKPKLSIGAAYAYLQTDATSPYARQSIGTLIGKVTDLAKVDYKVHNFTADLLFKGGGLTLLGAFHYRKAVDLPAAAKAAKNGIGGVAQAAYLFSNSVPLELQVNFGLIRMIKKATSNTIPDNELGAGFNYYFNRHAVKLQLEVARIWYENDTDKPRNETRVRAQLQVLL